MKEKWRLGRVPDAARVRRQDNTCASWWGGVSVFGNGEGMCCVSRAPAVRHPLPLAYGTGHKYSASDVLGLRLSQLDEKVQFLFP
jgi:hypothetical protein